MPQASKGGSGRGTSAASKHSNDEQRSARSEKGKPGKMNQGAQGQKGKEYLGTNKSQSMEHGKDESKDDVNEGNDDSE